MMKKVLMSLLVFLLMATVVFGGGPYNAIGKNPNLIDFSGLWPTALDLRTNGEDFVQWYRGRHYICQCTADMNPDAVASKLGEGWVLWHPAADDPRFGWCQEYIYKIN